MEDKIVSRSLIKKIEKLNYELSKDPSSKIDADKANDLLKEIDNILRYLEPIIEVLCDD